MNFAIEAVGCIGRAAANNATDHLMPYILQSVFLLVPPSLFAASIYMTLGRIIRGLGPKGESCCIIKIRWLTTIFVVGDVFGFMVQSGGAGFMAAGDDPKMGENIVVAGLFIQIIFFGIFIAAAVMFHRKYRQQHVIGGAFGTRNNGELPWESMFMTLYATSALILVHSVFRIIEYVMGSDGYLLENEWLLYVFDGLLMAAAMVIFHVWYPSKIRPFQPLDQLESMEMGGNQIARMT